MPRPRHPRQATADPAVDAEFSALYRRELAYVWRMLRAHGVPEAQVEDAVQDVFMVVHRRWDDWRAESRARSPRSWLFGVARRVAASHRRRHVRERERATQVSAADLPGTEEADRRQALADLERALATLDPRNRAVFVLAEIEGMTAREIAAVTDAKPNTVSWRLRTARAQVRHLMEPGREPGDGASDDTL